MNRILIVDDKEENLNYLQALLAGSDCTVESAHHGAEALIKARQTPPDLIISDLLMPVMDGYTLLRHWKTDPRLQAIPFVVYTATYIDPDDERLALSLGADAFILKPTEPEVLIARLREVQANAVPIRPEPPEITMEDESAQLKLYNDRLIRKLEEKTLQLEAANRVLHRDISDREDAELLQRQMAEMQSAILNALPAHIALVDAQGVIVSVNQAWRRFATANALRGQEFCVGQNYLEVCERAAGDCSGEAKEVAAGIRRVLQSKTKDFAIEYPCHSPTEQRWFRLMVTPLDGERKTGAVIMHVEITERKMIEEALRASERDFRELAEAMPQIVWVADPDGLHIQYNQHWMNYTGRTYEESLGHGWNPPFHPDDRQRAAERWQQATESGEPYEIEYRLRRSDGVYHWMLGRALPLRDSAGHILKWLGTCTDIHDLKLAELEVTRSNRAWKMLSTCNEAMIRAEGETELLERVCRIAVETGGYRMAWVGYAQNDEAKSIKPVAYAGVEEGYLSEVNISWNERELNGQGLAGQVIRSGEAAVCADFSRDPVMAHWQPMAERRGYRGVLALPLRDRQHTFGLVGLYSAEVNEPGPDELKLLQELADNLAFGIVHQRAGVVQQRLQTAVLKVTAAVSATTGDAFYEQLARNMAEALGAQAGFVSLLHPGDLQAASTLAAVIDGKTIANFDYLIRGTPCEDLVISDSCVIEREVAKQFPQAEWLVKSGAQAFVGRRLDSSSGQPLGHLIVTFREPLKDTQFVFSTLHIFAARAASEMERAQTDAQVSEQAALIDESHDAIVVSDLDHRITFWSKGAERLYGWSADEARGEFVQDLLAADPATFDKADMSVRETGKWSGEIQMKASNNSLLTVNRRWTLMRDVEGKPRSFLTIETDITEQKKIEGQFLRAQRMESIGTLAGGIAHDLNNALSPIMMSLEMLSLRFPDARSAELLSVLSASTQRGAEMVQQVLSFARGIEGQRVVLQIGQLIQEIEHITNDTFLKHIQVRANLPDEFWTVTGDPTQIHQVLLNLCVNARDAMPDGGTLTLSVENRLLDAQYAALNLEAKAGPYICISIEDSGTGLPPAVLDKIFDPFFTTKEVGKGTGLGLSTSLAIVKSHGGFIRVFSEPGNGTRFEVYLPAETELTAEHQDRISSELPRGNDELILVVDDEASVRVITQVTLETFGYRALLACDGAEAIALYASHNAEIAAVLTDITMPVMDGPSTIQVLRKLNPEVRIIATSGRTISVEVARACGLDAGHFIPKPYTAETLLSILREVLTEEP